MRNIFFTAVICAVLGTSCQRGADHFNGPEFVHSANEFSKKIQRADSVNYSYTFTTKSYFIGHSASTALNFKVHYPKDMQITQEQADWQLSELAEITKKELKNPDDFDVISVLITNGSQEYSAEKKWSH